MNARPRSTHGWPGSLILIRSQSPTHSPYLSHMNGEESVWYAAYGSNLDEERFQFYLQGGTYPMTSRVHPGSRDRSAVLERANWRCAHPLYMAATSKSWNGMAVAFIESKPAPTGSGAWLRLYRISAIQFMDVFLQENDQVPSASYAPVDLARLRQDRILDYGRVDDFVFYGRVLHLGELFGSPIVTFTTKRPRESEFVGKPSHRYLHVIAKGLHDGIGLTSQEISDYLIQVAGIKGNYGASEIQYAIDHPEPRATQRNGHP